MGNAQLNTNKEFPVKNKSLDYEERLEKHPQMKQRFEYYLILLKMQTEI